MSSLTESDAAEPNDAGPVEASLDCEASDADSKETPDASEVIEPSASVSAPDVGSSDESLDLPPLVILRRHDGKRFVMTPRTDLGGFDDQDLVTAREAFAWRKNNESHEIHPRLLDLLYRTARHFKAQHLILTSGYRPGRITSMHAHGRALDFQIPDVNCRKIAEHARGYGFVGVGLYPRTGSVHLDVREQSYFWISYAPRGVRWPEKGILKGLAKQMDREARTRGEGPTEPLPLEVLQARERISNRNKRLRRARRSRRKSRGATKRQIKAR
jgi:hypothetical protein